ncbi:LAGLIDADG family homing endonuclease, partial [Glycomyces tenuis]
WAADERLRIEPHTLTHAFPSGRKEVFRMTLTSGKEIEATANHRFLTVDGWVELRDLAVGSRIATPREVPEPLKAEEWPEAEVVLLAHMIGDGSMVKRQPIRYASVDEANLEAVTKAAEHFGVTAVRDDYAAARVATLRLRAPYRLTHGKRNPIAAWLDSLGLFDKRSHEKFVPAGVFSLPNDQVALFLRHLWATDGSVRWDAKGGQARIYYASTSRRLVDDLRLLLLRFEIQSSITVGKKGGYRDQYQLWIHDGADQLKWLRQIGVHGERGARAEVCKAELEVRRRRIGRDTLPAEVWNRIRALMADRGVSRAQLCRQVDIANRGDAMWKSGPSRPRLAKIAEVLSDQDLTLLAVNDVFWDKVESIEPIGEQDVYDATVLGVHNFIANCVISHNSLEQDADVVILLHRDDYYDKESPRAGEADFIVAKHRNGATDTITVAAQLHLSRFVDMAV